MPRVAAKVSAFKQPLLVMMKTIESTNLLAAAIKKICEEDLKEVANSGGRAYLIAGPGGRPVFLLFPGDPEDQQDWNWIDTITGPQYFLYVEGWRECGSSQKDLRRWMKQEMAPALLMGYMTAKSDWDQHAAGYRRTRCRKYFGPRHPIVSLPSEKSNPETTKGSKK